MCRHVEAVSLLEKESLVLTQVTWLRPVIVYLQNSVGSEDGGKAGVPIAKTRGDHTFSLLRTASFFFSLVKGLDVTIYAHWRMKAISSIAAVLGPLPYLATWSY